MKAQEKSSSELWYAIKELYQWRKGTNRNWSGIVLDMIDKTKDPTIKANCPELYTAYELWKAHPSEDVFFMLNNIRPEED